MVYKPVMTELYKDAVVSRGLRLARSETDFLLDGKGALLSYMPHCDGYVFASVLAPIRGAMGCTALCCSAMSCRRWLASTRRACPGGSLTWKLAHRCRCAAAWTRSIQRWKQRSTALRSPPLSKNRKRERKKMTPKNMHLFSKEKLTDGPAIP